MVTVNLQVSDRVQEASVDVIFVPMARVNCLNAPGSARESPALREFREASSQGAFTLAPQQSPTEWFDQSEVVVRLAATLSGWDLALVGFHGYLDSPLFVSGTVDGGTTVWA